MEFQKRLPEKKKAGKRRPLIHDFYASPLKGEEIERRSFSIIDREAPPHRFSPDEWEVVRRMVHATGDFSLIEMVRFSRGAIPAAVGCLASGRPIFVDSNMIRAGLSLARLQSVCKAYRPDSIVCHTSREINPESGLPRSLLAVRQAKACRRQKKTVTGF